MENTVSVAETEAFCLDGTIGERDPCTNEYILSREMSYKASTSMEDGNETQFGV
jgi:hypothetical protein